MNSWQYRKTRVGFIGLPQLVDDSLNAILTQTHRFEIFSRLPAVGTDLRRIGAQLDAIVCVQPAAAMATTWSEQFARPPLVVMNLSANYRSGRVFVLRPQQFPIPDLTPDALAAALEAWRTMDDLPGAADDTE